MSIDMKIVTKANCTGEILGESLGTGVTIEVLKHCGTTFMFIFGREVRQAVLAICAFLYDRDFHVYGSISQNDACMNDAHDNK